MEHDIEQFGEFLAAKQRLRDRMATARAELHAITVGAAEARRDFDRQLEALRTQVAPLLPAEQSVSKKPHAPPSTPAG